MLARESLQWLQRALCKPLARLQRPLFYGGDAAAHARGFGYLRVFNLRQGVCNLGAESGVSGRTRLLPRTLAHALVVLHNALPTGHETPNDECTHQEKYVGRWLSVLEALLRRYSTVSEAFLEPKITT